MKTFLVYFFIVCGLIFFHPSVFSLEIAPPIHGQNMVENLKIPSERVSLTTIFAQLDSKKDMEQKGALLWLLRKNNIGDKYIFLKPHIDFRIENVKKVDLGQYTFRIVECRYTSEVERRSGTIGYVGNWPVSYFFDNQGRIVDVTTYVTNGQKPYPADDPVRVTLTVNKTIVEIPMFGKYVWDEKLQKYLSIETHTPQSISENRWGPEQATRMPDTPEPGDRVTAWASLTPDEQEEWLVLEYTTPVTPARVKIYETYNPGAVYKIGLFAQDGKEEIAWTGKDPTPIGDKMGISVIPLNTEIKTKRIKLYLDSKGVPGWNEIDAVGLVDHAGVTQWAEKADASSTYARKPSTRAVSTNPVSVKPALNQPPAQTVPLSFVDDTAEGQRSIAASGHGVLFEKPVSGNYLEAVQIAASRYGTPEPPADNFHIYILNDKQQVLADLPFPYALIARGDLQWYTLPTPSIEVPEKFYVALNFNPNQTKGIYLALDKNVPVSHSYEGLPEEGYSKIKDNYDWMVRAYLADKPSGTHGTLKLADWKPPVKIDPFKDTVEITYIQDSSEGMQSYGGRGPGVRIQQSDIVSKTKDNKPVFLKGVRIYAGRYGSGYDTESTLLKVSLVDSKNNPVVQEMFPYSLFSYKPNWVDLVFTQPIPMNDLLQRDTCLLVAFDPEAHQSKGIYFHYNKNPKSTHSLAGNLEKGFKDTTDREWMVKFYFSTE